MSDGCGSARRWFERFHGYAPRSPRDVRAHPLLGCLARMGRLESLTYRAARPGTHWKRWTHDYARGARPDLYVDARGELHPDSRGRSKATATRGVVDMGGKKKGKKNPAHRNPYSGGSDADMWVFVERVGITGGAAVATNVVTKVAANKYLDEWEPQNRNYARGAAQMYLGWKMRRRYPRIMAGVAIGGAIVVAEELLTSPDERGFDLEREVNAFLNPPAENTSGGTGGTSGTSGAGRQGGALDDGNQRLRSVRDDNDHNPIKVRAAGE